MAQLQTAQTISLPFTEMGKGKSAPLVFLHGFGGDKATWSNLQIGLEHHRHTIAFDLPGHGAALNHPQSGSAGKSAKAVTAALDELGLQNVHLIGHSMGGAVASLLALRSPERFKSLTLLAPGGFGPEINTKLLRRYATATSAEEQASLLEQFVGFGYDLPKNLAEHVAANRARDGASEILMHICDQITDGDRQGVLPRADLGKLPIPMKVIWGTQDRVVPTRQCHKLPGPIACHVFDRVGHMVHMEIPREVKRLVLENTR
ncbi:alpha/beta fold hydrolase [Polycladidibacter hongkongensis]|uniref:alpha/beta fold hydrolase n=1 Tax=Polycladidibacter hongkongensis TaxID=1647556 RepID=UPI000B23B61D|nr:alpha/beta fold hydrolase [Pseudovibrio hongkongensis]